MVTSRVEIILNNTPFPGAGQQIGGHHVLESMVDVQGKNWAVYLKGKLTQAQVNAALSSMTKTHFALPVQDEFSLISFKPKGMTHARTNPPGDVTVVRGHMYYARPNPISKTDFHQEMDEMLIDNPEKHFTKYIVKNKDQLHERLWKGVSYAGESYGWKKGDELWHRRASFIMPKIKINKALKGATMFYHTHPSKDEPSLTSADDIQFYLDLHFAWGIKSFYTVMKHKLDHFTITSKPGGAEKYLRMEEDAFIDTVDGMIGKGEEVAKKEVSEDRPEVEFQNRITKEMVDLFNKKFKSIAKISFRPKAKNPASKLARKSPSAIAALVNPAPNPPIRVEDQYISKALEELKGLDYAHEHYGADEYGHTMYVYWWLRHHLAPTTSFPKGRLFKLQEYGLDQETRHKLRAYLSQSIIGNYNYMDAVYLLALYHDIAKLREKKSKDPGWEIGAEMFRTEIGPELNLPSNLVEDLAFLFDTDLGRKNIKDDVFLTQSGDYYGAAKLVQMADMVTHHSLMYTGKAKEAKASGKIGMASGKKYKDYAMTEMINDLRNFLDHHFVIQNPPPKVLNLKWMASYGIEDIPYQEARELLSDFHQSVIPDNNGKLKQADDKSSGGHIYYMRFDESVIPGLTRTYSAQLALSSSNLTIDIGSPAPDDLGKKVASQIYQLVGSRLKESYTEIELEEPEPEAIVNPRHASKIQVICISGPSGGGKSTVLKYLNKHIPDSSTPPSYTTRPGRKNDPARVFVSKTEFKNMIKRGEFVEYTVSGAGHYYGKRFKDFVGSVAIIEVSLQGKKHYEKRFPNLFSVYLDPDPSITEKDRAMAILRRGGITKDEAMRRAKNATETIKKSKKMQFDLRVTMMKGKYHEGAKKVLSEIPLVNPPLSVAPRDISPYTHFKRYSGNADYTIEDWMQVERKKGANEKEDIKRQQMKEAGQWATKQRNLVANGYAAYVSDKKGDLDVVAPDWYNTEFLWDYEINKDGKRVPTSRQWYGLIDQSDKPTFLGLDTFGEENPKDLFDWFEDWVKLVNMKNKELKTFLDSDWGKVAGLSPEEAKKLGINSGRTSGRRILKMRQKLGLTGPKDYIDPNKPRVIESFYTKAMDKWTGPATKKGTDWYWCTRQVRFNKRFMGDNFGERKGPLVRKQKTQNQPSRRLLSLWVWGHDPWRYARKVEKRESMPKCPSVPWIGMTEKRKYGVIEVIPGPRKNPPWKLEHQKNPYILLSEPWSGIEVPIDEMLAPLILHLWNNNVPTSYSDQGISRKGYLVIRWPYDYAKPIVEKLAKDKIVTIDKGGVELWKGGDRVFPENSITIRWERGVKNLEAIYKAFGLKYPKSRKDAEKMVADMSVENNPPSRPDQFTKTPIVYPGTIEKGLSANLLKAIKKVRQQNREYFGFASGTHIWTHTNFEPRRAGAFEDEEEKWKFIKDNDIYISFHTHPIFFLGDKWKKWSDVPSPEDYAFAVYHRLNFGIAYEIIYTQHGFFILQVLPKGKDSFSSWYTQEMFEHDSKVCLEAWNFEDGAERFRGVLTPLQHAQDTVRHINKNTKGVKFKLTFYDNPIIAIKWTEEEDGGYKGKRIKVNPQDPGMKTAFQRFQIGAYYGEPAVEDEHGHKIEGGKFDHEVHGMSEIIVVDSEDYPETKQFLDELYDEWLEAAKEIGIKQGGWFEALKATVNLRRYPPSKDFFEDFVKWKVSQGFLDKTFPIHEIVPYGGVCRHLGIVAAAILRRAIEEGHLGGKVYFDLGPGHAWTRYVTKGGTPIIFDAAQDKYGYLEDVNSGSKAGFEDGDGNRYLYPSGNLIYLNKEGFRDNPRTNQPTLDLAEIQQLYDESLAELEKYLAARQEIRDLLVLEEDEKFRAGYKALIAEYDGFIASALDTMKKMEHLATQIAPTLDLTDPSFRANPRTKKGRKFPSKYLKGLTATEKAIAIYEIDRGYEYDMDDPKAYEDWKSDIKAKARGLKTVPSKWRNKFAKKYGPLKKGYDFLDRMSKTTGVKRKYLKKIQDKGLAAWRVGHRPGVTPMQWARGRVYAFVMAAPSSTGPGKPDHKLAVEAGVR